MDVGSGEPHHRPAERPGQRVGAGQGHGRRALRQRQRPVHGGPQNRRHPVGLGRLRKPDGRARRKHPRQPAPEAAGRGQAGPVHRLGLDGAEGGRLSLGRRHQQPRQSERPGVYLRQPAHPPDPGDGRRGRLLGGLAEYPGHQGGRQPAVLGGQPLRPDRQRRRLYGSAGGLLLAGHPGQDPGRRGVCPGGLYQLCHHLRRHPLRLGPE